MVKIIINMIYFQMSSFTVVICNIYMPRKIYPDHLLSVSTIGDFNSFCTQLSFGDLGVYAKKYHRQFL